MKKFIMLFSVIILGITTLSAQNYSKTFKFNNNITGISAGHNFIIDISYGDSKDVVIVAPKKYLDYISISLNNGVLVFKTNFPRKFLSFNKYNEEIKVKLQMKELNYLDLSGAASLNANNIDFKVQKFKCNLSGATSVKSLNIESPYADLDLSGACECIMKCAIDKLEGEISGAAILNMSGKISNLDMEVSGAAELTNNVNSKNITLDCSGAASVKLSGRTEELKIEGSGACEIKAKNLIARNVNVEVTGASSAYINCTDTAILDSSGASSITYYGEPKKIITKEKSIRKGK